jgi:hypothetical protein
MAENMIHVTFDGQSDTFTLPNDATDARILASTRERIANGELVGIRTTRVFETTAFIVDRKNEHNGTIQVRPEVPFGA